MRLYAKPFLIAGVVVLSAAMVPAITGAETGAPGDVAYCRALSDVYVRYIGHDQNFGERSMGRGSNDTQVALTKCQQGDASGIPVLERSLISNKFTLPARG